jgi:hypothetical protein
LHEDELSGSEFSDGEELDEELGDCDEDDGKRAEPSKDEDKAGITLEELCLGNSADGAEPGHISAKFATRFVLFVVCSDTEQRQRRRRRQQEREEAKARKRPMPMPTRRRLRKTRSRSRNWTTKTQRNMNRCRLPRRGGCHSACYSQHSQAQQGQRQARIIESEAGLMRCSRWNSTGKRTWPNHKFLILIPSPL